MRDLMNIVTENADRSITVPIKWVEMERESVGRKGLTIIKCHRLMVGSFMVGLYETGCKMIQVRFFDGNTYYSHKVTSEDDAVAFLEARVAKVFQQT
jgi:hypothetical protein